ncbi:MAG: hypothetical protein ABL977_07225 [Candidatus Eisenbacteria bacterium]
MSVRNLLGAFAALLLLTPQQARAQGHDHAAMLASESANDAPRLDLHGFFDVTSSVARIRRAAGDSTTFGSALGQFDLFMSTKLAEHVSFLGELVVEAEDDGSSAIELERAYVRYSVSDHLRVTAGRTHSAVSYWYVTCHHGALLQPTIQRPMPVRFEDESGGGYLPAHAVGVELSGRGSLGDLTLDWVANVANGRSTERATVQTTRDRNRDKQVGASVSLSGSGPLEWHAGGALFRDRVAQPVALPGELDQDIASVHLVTRNAWFDETGEWFAVRNRERRSGAVQTSHAWYAVATFGPGRWRPYAALEGLRIPAADAFFAGMQDMDRGTLGVRFDVNASNTIKFEYRNGLSAGERTHELMVQTAFTF